jgi:DNA-binding transcriptional regulator LsrR (DeoR family)
MLPDNERNQLKVLTRAALLHHHRGLRQVEIAEILGVSQARVSRLLSSAVEKGILRTVVKAPAGLDSHLEDQLEVALGISQAHVVEQGADLSEGLRNLGRALASFVEVLPLDKQVIGFTSWSRPLREFARVLDPLQKTSATRVVELLGDIGAPSYQHQATVATESFARKVGAEPVFLRTSGVVASPNVRAALLQHDPHVQRALKEMDQLDVALVGIGGCESSNPGEEADDFFSVAEFDEVKALGAVGQVNLRFIDAAGAPVKSRLDDLVIGVTLDQLRHTPLKVGVAAGQEKIEAIEAAARGGWIDVLFTDQATALRLIEQGSERLVAAGAALGQP